MSPNLVFSLALITSAISFLALLWIAFCVTKIKVSVVKGFNQLIIAMESLDTRLANLERRR